MPMKTFVIIVGRLAAHRRMASRGGGCASLMQSTHCEPTDADTRQSLQAGRPHRVQARPVARMGCR
jgi:hypothetical protein